MAGESQTPLDNLLVLIAEYGEARERMGYYADPDGEGYQKERGIADELWGKILAAIEVNHGSLPR